jgi:hypothetical protein
MGFTSKLKKGELIIDDSTPFDFALPPKGKGRGLVFPMSMAPYSERETSEPFPDSLLIDESEWPERIKEMEQTKTRVSDIVARASLECKNQAMTNYCWGNSPAYAMEVIRVIQGQRKVYLSPASACAQIMNYQNNGGWADAFMKFVEKYGLVPESSWPANHWQDARYATQANKEKALNYRQTEWWQLRPRTDKEMMSCLLRRWPVSVGYNWWGHQITLEDPVWLNGTYAGRGRNSWGMNWPSQGAGGYFILQGFRLTPDDAVVPRQAKAA